HRRIVDERPDRTQAVRGGEHALHLFGATDVGERADRAHADLAGFGGYLLRALEIRPRVDHHIVAGPGKREHDRSSEIAGTTGDQCDPAHCRPPGNRTKSSNSLDFSTFQQASNSRAALSAPSRGAVLSVNLADNCASVMGLSGVPVLLSTRWFSDLPSVRSTVTTAAR